MQNGPQFWPPNTWLRHLKLNILSKFPQIPQMSNTFPVNALVYNTLEAILLTQAKKLTEDIAKFQKADAKDLWAQIRPQIRIALHETETEDLPLYCSHPLGNSEGAIRQRCRAPCLLGFSACPCHVQTPLRKETAPLTPVKRLIDYDGTIFFQDPQGYLIDKNGSRKGFRDPTTQTVYVFEIVQDA